MNLDKDHSDYQRMARLYHFLSACLAMKEKAGGVPNAMGIASRLGDKELRRTIRYLLRDDVGWEEKENRLGKIGKSTTGNVIQTLVKLQRNLQEDYKLREESYTRVLTTEDILTVLYTLTDLTPQERRDLNLPAEDGLTLLQRTLLIVQTGGGLKNYEMILRVYKAAVGLDFTNVEPTLDSLKGVDDLIVQSVNQSLEYLPHRSGQAHRGERFPNWDKTAKDLIYKAQREVRRLLTHSGNWETQTLGSAIIDSYVDKYLPRAFVVKLAQTVVANERLTEQYPVYLKRISLTTLGPLPFASKQFILEPKEIPYRSLLNPALQRWDKESVSSHLSKLSGPGDYELASLDATQVVAEFYVKVPDGYRPAIEKAFDDLTSDDRRRMDFSLTSTGVGGSLSHVIKVINIALLQDIPCLDEYFTIAHDVTSTQAIIRDNIASPVWAHSLVELCRKEIIGETLQACSQNQIRAYKDFAFAEPIGHGDYCGFDFLLSQAQASIHSRLRAIRNAGVLPSRYLHHLCRRVEQWATMKEAWNSFRGYPFSSLAMIGIIQQRILSTKPEKIPLTKSDPCIYFDACLSIVEVFLSEGIYRPAREYLRWLEILDEFVDQGERIDNPHVNTTDTSTPTSFEVFSGALIVRYLICLANYYWLYDTTDGEEQYFPPRCSKNELNRHVLVQRAYSYLDQAQHHLSIRLRKYVVVDEISQGTFHPHYELMGRIAFLRAKLLIFSPRSVPEIDNHNLPTERFIGLQRTEASIHWGRLYLTEKARLYAATDGNSELYACYAAMQCWTYLIAAYASPMNLDLAAITGGDRTGFSQLHPEKCLEWAHQLRDHALISYAETGRRCYYQIKEKSGLPEARNKFGYYSIERIPAISEFRGEQYREQYNNWVQSEENILLLNMSLLAVNPKDLPKLSPNLPTDTIYLFGTNACYLFFARGLCMLCNDADVTEEFKSKPSTVSAIHWEEKLLYAMRLLNMAWVIAEEGNEIEEGEEDGEQAFFITRSFITNDQADEYISPEVSIRDLYPRRVTEIADLGKIFAAACMVLRLSLVSSEERTSLENDVLKILGKLHSTHALQQSKILMTLTKQQKRYNGHLQDYLTKADAIVREYINTDDKGMDVRENRNALVRELFSSLLTS